GISNLVEDYAIFQIDSLIPARSITQLVTDHRHTIAQILRAETQPLSEDEIEDVMSRRISFGVDDITVVDWNSALVIDPDADDVIAILEFANVELMEMRNLDRRLGEALTL